MSRLVPALLILCALLANACSRGPDPAVVKSQSIAEGEKLRSERKYAEAAAAFERAVQADPTDGELRLTLSNTYLEAENWSRSATEAIRAADLLPDRIDVQVLAAKMAATTGKYLDAIDRARSVQQREPGNLDAQIIWATATARLLNTTWALYRLADAESRAEFEMIRSDLRPLVLAEDDAAAEKALRQVRQQAPTLMEGRLALANFLWATDRADEAEPLLRGAADEMPSHGVVNHALGRYYLLAGRFDGAERYLKNAAATGKGGAGARFALADLYTRNGRTADAAALLNSMLADDDAGGEVTVRLAAAEFAMGRQREAVARLDGLLAKQPRHVTALVHKAQILMDLRQIDGAVTAARSAVQERPESAEAHLALGQALLARDDVTGAHRELTEAIRLRPGLPQASRDLAHASLMLHLDPDALTFAREAVRQDPSDTASAVLLVRALTRAGRFAEAETELTKALAKPAAAPEVLVARGELYAARGNLPAARAAYAEAIRSAASALEALSGLVDVEIRDGKVGAARQAVNAALQREPKNTSYMLLAARASEAEGDNGAAEATLRQVLQLDRRNAQAMISLSDLLARAGRRNEAIAMLQEFSKDAPTTDVRTALAMLLEQTGRAAEAQAIYEAVVARDDRAFTAWLRLASIQVSSDADKALDLARSVRDRSPDNAAANDLLGAIYLKKDLPGQALPFLEAAVRLQPNDPTYRFHLGQSLQGIRQYSEARVQFNRALEINPNFPNANEARAALARSSR